MSKRSRLITGGCVVALNAALITLAYLSGAWLLPLGGVTWLPVLWMCVSNKPLWDPEDVGF